LRAPIFEEKVIDFIVELAKLAERKVNAAGIDDRSGGGKRTHHSGMTRSGETM